MTRSTLNNPFVNHLFDNAEDQKDERTSLFAWTVEVPILETQTDSYEDKVEKKHGEPKAPVHLPPEAGDADDDEDQHGEE